jgi:plastocyanin
MKSYFSALLLFALMMAGCSQPQPAQPKEAAPAAIPPVVIDPATAGTITGAVSFPSPTTFPRALDMSQDPACPGGVQTSETLMVKSGKLANVFVYVKEGLPAGPFPVPVEPAVLDQKGCRYIPHVLGIMAGQKLQVLNDDNAQHNVHPMPRANSSWNESQAPHGSPLVKTFSKPELMMAVQCNQHPWMKMYLNVMTHPYFAVSGDDGSFEIRNLPPGEYTLAAVHEKLGEQTVKIRVGPREKVTAQFSFAAAPSRR